MDGFQLHASTAGTLGIPCAWLSPGDIAARWPLVHTDDLIGAHFHPTDGHINARIRADA